MDELINNLIYIRHKIQKNKNFTREDCDVIASAINTLERIKNANN